MNYSEEILELARKKAKAKNHVFVMNQFYELPFSLKKGDARAQIVDKNNKELCSVNGFTEAYIGALHNYLPSAYPLGFFYKPDDFIKESMEEIEPPKPDQFEVRKFTDKELSGFPIFFAEQFQYSVMNFAIEFHQWMLNHDTQEDAEMYFGYTDEDMFREFLRQRK